MKWFNYVRISLALSAAGCINVACAQQADFNEVGKQVAILLQNNHYSKLSYNSELATRFLDEYIQTLDPARFIFTQADIEALREKHALNLHSKLLSTQGFTIAKEIHALFLQRLEERMGVAQEKLKESFDFNTNKTFSIDRKNAPWPKDQLEANELIGLKVKSDVINERLISATKSSDHQVPEKDPIDKLSKRYQLLVKEANSRDETDIADLFFTSISQIYDPHTDYWSSREMEEFEISMANELIGIGASLKSNEDGSIDISAIVIGGPADLDGRLKINDRIIGVDTKGTNKPEDMVDTTYMNLNKVIHMIRGKIGTKVGLLVLPPENEPGKAKTIMITRGKVAMKDELASGEIVEKSTQDGNKVRIGVLTLPAFYSDFKRNGSSCSADVAAILNRFILENIQGLVLDLSNDGGGSLEEARIITGFFIPSPEVVQVKDNRGEIESLNAKDTKVLYQGPMVVLVNKQSASASEIVAGALQDYKRAVIVGDTATFGKGTVQQPISIANRLSLFSNRDHAGSLKITIQKFYRPSGSSTQHEGVKSDIHFPSIFEAVEFGEKFMDYALEHDEIEPSKAFKPLPNSNLFIDLLKTKSEQRVVQNRDFQYIKEEIQKSQDMKEKNIISLNYDQRLKEIQENKAKFKLINDERKERYAKMAKQDAEALTFYQCTLDQAKSTQPLKAYIPSSKSLTYFRSEEIIDEEKSPDFPSNLSPQKREAIHIVYDLYDMIQSSKIASSQSNTSPSKELR